MFEIFHYDFMIRAFAAGLIIAGCLPLLGGFLVARRYSLIADSLAHVSLAGVGASFLLGFTPVLIALPVAVGGAILLEWLRQNKQISGETSLAILMSSGLALAVVLTNLAHGARADFNSYLFGSITTTSPQDLVILAFAAVGVAAVILWNYRPYLYIAFSEDGARIAGYKVKELNYILAAATAIMVVLSLRIVGGLLISALLVIPIVTAGRFAKSFAQTITLAIALALVSVIVGLVLAFYVGLAAGGAIVLTAMAIFLLSLLPLPNR